LIELSIKQTGLGQRWIAITYKYIIKNGDAAKLPIFLAGIKQNGGADYFAGCYTLHVVDDVSLTTNLWWLDSGCIAAVPSLLRGIAKMQCA
jgi:hypothetical protein